jgi:hypothetical protein
MPKQSLYQLVKTIAKKGKIQITPPRNAGNPPKRAGSPARAASPARAVGVVRVSAPLARPCGSNVKGQKNPYSKSELVALAKASGVDHKQDMDSLCAALGISPHQAEVDLPAKQCDSKARGDDRYTRDQVKRLAMARGITLSGKTMTDLCNAVGISRAQVLPRGASPSVSPRVSPPRARISPPRVPLARSASLSSVSSAPSQGMLSKQAQLFNNPSIWGRPESGESGLVPMFQQPRMGAAEPSSSSMTPMGDIFDQIPSPKPRTRLTAAQRQSIVDDLVSIQPSAGPRRSSRLKK